MVNGSPEIVSFTFDPNEDLIEMPSPIAMNPATTVETG
jgi:hypothetical protein